MIIITGSSGFIGTHLVRKLVRLGEDVIGCDVVVPKFEHSRFHHINLDFTSCRKLEQLNGYPITCCYHLGAVADINFARQNLKKTVRINVIGTANIVNFCHIHNIPLNYMSTCCVYGQTNQHPTIEDAPKRPTEIYGCTKLAGEQIVQGYFQLTGLKHNIMRSSTVYGPEMRPALAVHIFLERARRNEPLLIHGSGEQTRTFVYIDDLIDGIVRLRSEFFNLPINFAGKETLDILSVAKRCIAVTKSKSTLRFVEDRKGQIMHEEIDISLAERLLGWKPKISFEEGLQRLARKWF